MSTTIVRNINSKTLTNDLVLLANKAAKSQGFKNKMEIVIAKYIDLNSDILFAFAPLKQLVFSEFDKAVLFEASGIDKKTVRQSIKDSTYIYNQWVLSNDPFNVLITLIIREYAIMGNTKMKNLLFVYLTFKLYTSKYARQFKHDPNENIMRYAVNNMSNRFKLKQKGNLYAALEDTAIVSMNNYEERLIKGTDKDVVDFINGIDARISGFIVNVATEFYKAHDDKKYFNLNSDSLEEDDYHIADNISYGIERISDKISILISTEGVDNSIVSIAAAQCNVSENSLFNAIKTIIEVRYKDIREFIKMILAAYVFDAEQSLESVTSKTFIIEAVKIYKKNNTNAENILKIKELLDIWLNESSEVYRKSNRAATLNDFRRALYLYFIMYIQINSAK